MKEQFFATGHISNEHDNSKYFMLSNFISNKTYQEYINKYEKTKKNIWNPNLQYGWDAISYFTKFYEDEIFCKYYIIFWQLYL